MSATQLASNPFALLVDPQAVLTVVERSERLARLQSRVCRPLDKPLIAHTPTASDAFDADVDSAPDLMTEDGEPLGGVPIGD